VNRATNHELTRILMARVVTNSGIGGQNVWRVFAKEGKIQFYCSKQLNRVARESQVTFKLGVTT